MKEEMSAYQGVEEISETELLLMGIFGRENNVVIADAVMICDGQGNVISVHDTYEYFFGVTKAYVVGKSVYELEEEGIFSPSVTRMVMEQLRRLSRSRGITCIVNLHQVDFALEFSDRIVGLRAGEKVFDGSPAECTPDVIRGIYEGDAEAMVDVAVGVEKDGRVVAPAAPAMGEAR